ncbi:MAG: hypothetical protein JW770_06265 [Actinobacteria bacterium]|nr:hypothetical protein [Actinomycetota bacterium]
MAKLSGGCPGQDTAFLKDFNTNIVACPKCGHEVEFFSDERKVRCPQCHSNIFKMDPGVIEYRDGKIVFGDTEKSCLDWCGACMNRKDYSDIKENKKRVENKKEDFKKLVAEVDPEDSAVIGFFIEAFKKSINSPKLIDGRIFDALLCTNPGLFARARNYYLDFLESQ